MIPFYRCGNPRKRCDHLKVTQVSPQEPVSLFSWGLKGWALGLKAVGTLGGVSGLGKQHLGLGFEG